MRKLNEPVPSLPPPEKSGGASSLQIKLTALIDELRRAARKTGVDVDGPLGPVLSAFILILEWLGACIAELRGISVEYGHQSLQRLQAVRADDEAATTRMQTQMEAAKVRILHDFRDDIAKDFDKLTAGRVHAEIWKISLIAALVLVASGAACLAVGYRWGRASAEASIHETESRLMAAFRYGVNGASYWVGLMSWNNIDYALELCRTRSDLSATQRGRRACNVPLWIEPDQGAPDVVLDDILDRAHQMQGEEDEALRAPPIRDQIEAAPAPSAKPRSPPDRSKSSR
ncbi:MAG TPA: hypothetical protein VEK34_06945 [Methylocella sp.]|nr:hypothetical protein [Methylocella sp.]